VPRVSAMHLEARRAQILDAARSCFARHGYEGATVRRLEQAAGLSRGTIFHHFRDKESLFLALAEQDAAQMAAVVAEHGLVQVMRDLLDGGPAETVSWLGTRLEVSRRLRTDPAFRAGWNQHSAPLVVATRERLQRQLDAGVLREDVPLDVVAAYLELVFEGLISHLAKGLPTDHFGAVLDLVESGLRR